MSVSGFACLLIGWLVCLVPWRQDGVQTGKQAGRSTRLSYVLCCVVLCCISRSIRNGIVSGKYNERTDGIDNEGVRTNIRLGSLSRMMGIYTERGADGRGKVGSIRIHTSIHPTNQQNQE